ncbi:MAG TPA: hypothetical protein PLZ95_06585 [Bryobacteraceae bacterium]|nr:hypothetical protein [Bryobacteraceae bacterium]
MNEASSLAIEFELRPAVRAISRRPREKAEEAPSPHRYARYPRIVQVMALAIHFREMLERGEAKDYADLARLGCVSRERISQIMMLNWLAPDIQEDVLRLPKTPGGRFPFAETKLRSIAGVLTWEQQRVLWQRAI